MYDYVYIIIFMKHFFLSPALYILLSQVFCAALFISEVEENISFNRIIPCTLQDIYLHNPNIKWNDIIGLDAAKQLVKEAVVYPIRVSVEGTCLITVNWTSAVQTRKHGESSLCEVVF